MEKYDKGECDWRYMASCCADYDCSIDCEMPCPYEQNRDEVEEAEEEECQQKH